MKSCSIAEARANLPTIVDEVEAGEEIELTRRGKPVAVVLSRREYDRIKAERLGFGDAYRQFRQRFELSEVGAERGFFDSLRDPGEGRKVDL